MSFAGTGPTTQVGARPPPRAARQDPPLRAPQHHRHLQLRSHQDGADGEPSLYERELAAARALDADSMTYEQLQDLCSRLGSVARGVPREALARIPTRVLVRERECAAPKAAQGGAARTVPQDASRTIAKSEIRCSAAGATAAPLLPCAAAAAAPAAATTGPRPRADDGCCICMGDLLEDGAKESRVKSLPCRHTFHARCIRQWLTNHTTCPVCKADVARQAASVGALLFQLM